MAEVIPFKGVLYNVPRISEQSGDDLMAPPYDIITPEYQEELYQRSPYNIVRVDFGKPHQRDTDSANKYTRAKALLEEWLSEQVMVRSEQPNFYAYEITYFFDGVEKKLRGFLGLVRLEELGKGNIHPHECTHSKPKKDRFDLMSICGANVSPIFSLYNSPERRTSAILETVCRDEPYVAARDHDGAVHRLWTVQDEDQIQRIRDELNDKTIFIADGHHRYETALEYQKEMRGKEITRGGRSPYDYVLMFLANMSDDGLTILPAHRLAKRIPDDTLEQLSVYFDIEKIMANLDIATSIAQKRNCFGFYKGEAGTWYKLTYRGGDLMAVAPALRELDVSILHELILSKLLHVEDIAYEMDVAKTLQFVDEKHFEAAFFLNPTRVSDVERVALASLRMPPKSTYFYPKLLTGLVLNIFQNSF